MAQLIYPIETLRVRVGLTSSDASKDTEIQAANDIAFAIVESYLDRKLEYVQDVENFFGGAYVFLLRRWPLDMDEPVTISSSYLATPVSQIAWIVSGTPSNPSSGVVIFGSVAQALQGGYFAIDPDKGIVYCPSYAVGWPLAISYTGGFETLPPDLMFGMGLVFDSVWGNDPAFGGVSGGTITGSGEVKKISLVGIGSVDFDVGTTVSEGSDTGSSYGLIPANAKLLIDNYRRETVAGCG